MVTLSLLNLTANGETNDTLSKVDTRFINAPESKYSATIAELVRQDTKVTQTQPDGMTVIQWAAYHDGQQTGRLLINANCQADETTRKEVTPLSIAWQPALTPTSRRPGTKMGGGGHTCKRFGSCLCGLAWWNGLGCCVRGWGVVQ